MRMQALQFLHERRSTPSRLLAAPGPDDGQLRQLLECAVRVPDHGNLTPWRLLLIRGKARLSLGEFLAARSAQRNPEAAKTIEKDRLRFGYAPLVIVVIAHVHEGHKVPAQEQLLSAGAVCLTLLQAADALGFGAQWLTGWAAYDAEVAKRLGVRSTTERVVGFIHIGTASERIAERERPPVASCVTELSA